MMTIRIYTDSGMGVIANVSNSLEAAGVLLELSRKGIRCIRWEVCR